MSKVVGISLVKDEIDILPYVIDHLYSQDVNHFVIADNGSTDGTFEYLFELTQYHPYFNLFPDPEVGYYQAAKMNSLVREAAKIFGEDITILPFDADEMFFSLDPDKTLSEALKTMECDVAIGIVNDHVPTPQDLKTGNPLEDMMWRMPEIKSPPSVAFRYHPDATLAMGNHSVGHPGTSSDKIVGVRHFQYRSLEQYSRKLRNGKKAYDATDLPSDYGTHWRIGGASTDEQLYSQWQAYTSRQDLIFDPAPYGKLKEK